MDAPVNCADGLHGEHVSSGGFSNLSCANMWSEDPGVTNI